MTISWSINNWSIPYFYFCTEHIFVWFSPPLLRFSSTQWNFENACLLNKARINGRSNKSSDCDSFIFNKCINISFGCNCSQYVTGRAFRCNPGNALSLSLSLSLSSKCIYLCPIVREKGICDAWTFIKVFNVYYP